MTELRKLIKQDILDIRDNLIEPGKRDGMTDRVAEFAESTGTSYTYLKDGAIVGCCGGSKMYGVWQLWALYAKGFTAITTGRCARAFVAKFKQLFKGEPGEIGIKVTICEMARLCGLVRYVKFLGGVFVRTEKWSIDGETYNIYEVI